MGLTAMQLPGLVIAAPSSNSGKTVITLGLLRALANRGVAVSAAKTGPDYIDPAFQAAACRQSCINLDPWAMSPDQMTILARRQAEDKSVLLCEGVMGLFDGAADGAGSTADLAALMNWPVVLVIDVKGQSMSAAAVIAGFASFRKDVKIAAVILNRVGSDRHRAMVETACAQHLPDIPVIGAVRRSNVLSLPERHLGLVQAGEHDALDGFLDQAAAIISDDVDLDRLIGLVHGGHNSAPLNDTIYATTSIPPLGRHIAVARDRAFAFAYPHVLEDWRRQGAVVSFFSPLADETPDDQADAVYLPGGYPELHGATLAGASKFKASLMELAGRNIPIYGECGGYMVLGKALIDGNGDRHDMLGLLPLVTSFADRRLHLGYRALSLTDATPFGPAGTVLRGHEFHYASTVSATGVSLGSMVSATGEKHGPAGLIDGSVFGSFFHMICR
ncbi:cobyrinate a,c-diamide synthase [Thalassospira alkalitolerans]|uniref:cobyrinate a,c-diamide synthase n=1 Tax=Thalassospira alkalitolerans TaxID=1293890 RepID=UPI003AA7B296